MLSLITGLTANATLSASGIKNFKVFYDTLLINFKVEKYDIVLVENINFDYSTNTINSSTNGIKINFGNTNCAEANKTLGNAYIDTILLEKEKTILICGLSAYYPLTQTINAQTHSGSAMTPIVYTYDLNEHTITKLFPIDTSWTTNLLGNITKYSDVAVSFNTETNILNYLIKATRFVNTSAFYFWTDIEMQYLANNLTLTSVRTLSSLSNNDLQLVAFRNYNQNEKLVITTTNTNDIISFRI